MTNDTKQKESSHLINRRDFISKSIKVGSAAFTTALLPKLSLNAGCQYNVVLIIADDLRPLLGSYGYPKMYTPNIDRIAQRGTLFNRAYCQYPLCHPSRTSMLTGLRPNTTNVISNTDSLREKLPNVITMPQHFKTHGYHTQSVGKVAHNVPSQDDAYSWSVPSYRQPISYDPSSIPSWQALNVEDDELRDGKAANQAVLVLEEIQNEKFFLAVGFRKPHLPFNAPKSYYDLYDGVNFDLPASSSIPKDAPSIANVELGWFSEFQDIPEEGPLSEAKTLELIRGYAASTTYMDAQVGLVLDQLDALHLTEKTVLIFASDHGFHVGDHGIWRKFTLFETALRSALIVSVPWQTHQGVKTDAITELVDIYPTLCDVCQLPIPEELEGISMLPVIEQPNRPWKTAAYSQIGSGRGNSLRTERYRITEWGNKGQLGRELYDYHADPNETINIADLPENTELVEDLRKMLYAGWENALPNYTTQITSPQNTLPWDINNDGIVDIEDLMLVSSSFGQETTKFPKVDVNKDGIVDIIDLLIVASHLGEKCYASAPKSNFTVSQDHIDSISEWLTEAYRQDNGSNVFRDGIANLEILIDNIIPNKTQLLPNYPNPFNPETWIPYDLAKDADVDITICNLKGEVIRQLSIGFQIAGSYRTKGQAAYWDGRNFAGELVASGIYFCTIQTGQTKATRKLVMGK